MAAFLISWLRNHIQEDNHTASISQCEIDRVCT
jgi:hypothetical protein